MAYAKPKPSASQAASRRKLNAKMNPKSGSRETVRKNVRAVGKLAVAAGAKAQAQRKKTGKKPMPARSNKGGAMRGQARAAYVRKRT